MGSAVCFTDFANGGRTQNHAKVEEPKVDSLGLGIPQLLYFQNSKFVLESQTSLLWKKQQVVATDQCFPVLSQIISALISRKILGSLMCSEYWQDYHASL